MSRKRELLEELSTKDTVSYYYPDLINRIKDLLAQPEPKQKPLSGKDIAHGFRCSNEATHADSFWAGVEYAEKAHGIGE